MIRCILFGIIVLCSTPPSATAQGPLLLSSIAGPHRIRDSSVSVWSHDWHDAALTRDSLPFVRRRTFAGTGALLGALIGGLLAADSCRRNDCHVPVIPVALLVGIGGAMGALVGLFIDR